MPPAKNIQITNEEFLAACFKYAVEKPRIDYEKLSAAVGMSSGGAANKLRNIMKKWEEDGDVFWADKEGSAASGSMSKKSATKRKAPTKKAALQISTKNLNPNEGNTDSDADTSDTERPKKKSKARATTKKTPDIANGVGTDKALKLSKEKVASNKPGLHADKVQTEDSDDKTANE